MLWFGKKKKKQEAGADAEAVVVEAPVAEEATEHAPDTEPEPLPPAEEVSAELTEGGEAELETPPSVPSLSLGSTSPASGGGEATPHAPEPAPAPKKENLFSRLTSGLRRSSSKIADGISSVFTKKTLDDDTLEELEELLITSDMGVKAAGRITQAIAKDRFDKEVTDTEIKAALAQEIAAILKPRERHVDFADGPRPRLVLFVGVNGSGKTTTIGKIASSLKAQGAKAMLVAGDTFRAAAIEQLTVWGERAGIPVIAKSPGADSAGLVYEAFEKAQREGIDLVLVDTAGRLQNKAELMSELAKIIRVARKLDPDAPHDVFLVLDATVGQNALSQVEAFRTTAEVTGLVMTKLDGTARGGVLVAIAEAHDLPIHYVGVGERAEDLQPFDADSFARALVGLD